MLNKHFDFMSVQILVNTADTEHGAGVHTNTSLLMMIIVANNPNISYFI